MSGLWRNDPETPEGKYPIVLRRDGTPLEARYFVIALKDPATEAALRAYAKAARGLGFDADYVRDVLALADDCVIERRRTENTTEQADPDAPRHRSDDPAVLAWARSIGCPGS